MPEIGWAGLGIVPEVDNNFYTKLGRDVDPGLARVGRTSGSRFGSILGKAAAVTAGGAVVAGFAAFKLGKSSVEQASTLNESLNAVNVTYRKQANAVKALGRESAVSLGLSNSEFNGLAVQFSGFATKVSGGSGRKVVSTLDDLTTRAADFASVMNLDVADAASLFQSGLAGETEPLRRFGIDMSAAAVQAQAYKTGIADVGSELTEGEKVQARYSLLMEQTSKAQGDFANTSDSLANRQRILNARWDDAQAKLGTALLPVIEDVTGYLLDEGIPAFEKFADWFAKDAAPAIGDFRDELAPLAHDVLPILGDGLMFARDMLSEAIPFARDLVGWFKDLPDGVQNALLVGGGLYAGSKLLGGGQGGVRGGGFPSLTPAGLLGATKSAVVIKSGELLADRLLAKFQKPLPVFVTNPAFAAASGGSVVAGAPAAKGGSKLSRFAKGGAALVAGALAFAFGDDAADAYMDGFTRNSKWADRLGRHFDSTFGETTKTALNQAGDDVARYTRQFDKIPETLQSRFNLLGVPETEGQLRKLLRVYDIAAKDRRTTLELLGYEPLLDRISRINKELDWAARPREARIAITKVYGQAGYETRGGLQEGGGGPVTRNRSRSGGGLG